MKPSLLGTVTALVVFPTISHAQTVDPANTLNAALAGLRPYVVERVCRNICDLPGAVDDSGQCIPYRAPVDPAVAERTYSLADPETTVNYLAETELRDGCCTELRRECQTRSERLSVAGEVSLRVLSVQYSELQEGEPRAADSFRVRIRNCSSATAAADREITLSGTESNTISLGRSVLTTRELEAGIEAELSFIKIGSKASISRSVDISRSTSSTESNTVSRSTGFSVEVPPQSYVIADSVLYQNDGVLPFEITVLADAPVTSNLEGVEHASDVLSEAARSIVLDGRITAVATGDAFTETYDGPEDCANSEDGLVSTIIGSQ